MCNRVEAHTQAISYGSATSRNNKSGYHLTEATAVLLELLQDQLRNPHS